MITLEEIKKENNIDVFAFDTETEKIFRKVMEDYKEAWQELSKT